jgi:phage FluMu protein Com
MLFLVVFILLIVIVFFVISKSDKKPHSSSMNCNSVYSHDDSFSTHKPKISAEVSENFYDAVQEYCQSNSITISALIRKAVGSYIDFDLTSSSYTFPKSTSSTSLTKNSSNYWKCPLCEKLNANYVGTCSCGGTKDSPPKLVPKKPSYIRKDGSWKCPKCGTVNAAYVGSCSCGQNKGA